MYDHLNCRFSREQFDGDVGVLERKHIQTNSIVYIGKEANNIDEQQLDVELAQVFIDEKWIAEQILNLPQKIAEECGVDRKTFQTMKKSMRESLRKGEKINLFAPARKRLLEYLYL